MQLFYKVKGSSGNWLPLADPASGAFVKEWKPKATGALDKVNLAAMPGQISNSYRLPLGNLKETVPLFLDVSYADYATALATAAVVKQTFMGNIVHLKVVEGATVQYYANGVTDSMETTVAGCNVVYNFTLETDLVSGTEPS